MTQKRLAIIGGGLAGSEAALQLAGLGLQVDLYEMKPEKRSAAHHSDTLAEIVCSNSFGSQGESTASGLLKLEMEALGSKLLEIARQVAVPAGKALAVDREQFTARVTETVQNHPLIHLHCEEVTELPEADYILIATGPLTTPALVEAIGRLLNRKQLYFFDAASPIIARDSIDFGIAYISDRYANEKTNASDITETNAAEQSYINCPLDKPQYEALLTALLASEKTELKDFEKESASYFESCLPIEVIASRGIDTLRYGPFKPVGLPDPKTGQIPHAVVQLRQDNAEGTLYNMVGCQTNIKWGDQKKIIQMIPGLTNAEVVRYGVMHRNTYIHSPEVLAPTLQLKQHPHILFAGQLTGTEGYSESIATGLWAALNMARLALGQTPGIPPKTTMLGALLHYITRAEAIGKDFQPINSNWGILEPLDIASFTDVKTYKLLRRNKPQRNAYYAERALTVIKQYIFETKEAIPLL
ncbi:MAG: methylenetetrahydrofolate--tRNA-(uracil(54)-C(5))-methyltransferase (FADH(2)-oxidizing) TrmFO [Vampirovibrionales bacterium]|nr:methylenetetrahydrofolate--tRNA-(uracil(54)-C(5))-methyltransferase (FADH(2)-oxidizing) TrmFO [Vampirovibrionales bacterium]